jgi:hypothetical protein
MSILDLEQGMLYRSKKDAARGLRVSLREVDRLLALAWLVWLRVPRVPPRAPR